MTDSALEKARRETETWCPCCRRVGCAYQSKDKHGSCCQPLHRAITRLEAAARIAGRLEQAERFIELMDEDWESVSKRYLIGERDRLRRAAEQDGKP